MLPWFSRKLLGIALLASAAGLTECQVENTLDDQIWPCKTREECGTKDGRPMACWEGYCMPSCDPAHPPDDSGVVCLDEGVLVETCNPDHSQCSAGLSCYRTDLLYENGYCVPFPTCSKDGECTDEDHPSCASTVLDARIDNPAALTNHLRCVSVDCDIAGMDCPSGERCLGNSYVLGGNVLPDICSPFCDADDLCPINYACARSAAAPGADRICIPGLPGVRCTRDRDCIAGSCIDTGAGLRVCALPCVDNELCEEMSAPPTYYYCQAPIPGGPTYCMNASVFQGTPCPNEGRCGPQAPQCFHYDVYEEMPINECRPPCDANGHCETRGGFPHVCLDNPDNLRDGGGGCYPGFISMPCKNSDECIAPARCESITLDGYEYLKSDKICTLRCLGEDGLPDHSLCRLDPDHPKSAARPLDGYCSDDGFCRSPLKPQRPCRFDDQCSSRTCLENHTCF